jgi:hypothetical protein
MSNSEKGEFGKVNMKKKDNLSFAKRKDTIIVQVRGREEIQAHPEGTAS